MAKRTSSKKGEVTKPASQRGRGGKSAAANDEVFSEDEGGGGDGPEFDAEKFLAHVDNVGSLKSKGAAIRGQIGAAVKAAEEDYGIHRGAASLWIKLKNMNDDARTAFLSSFDNMRTALGYATQTDLFDGKNSPAERATFAGRGTSTT